jgi:acetyl esterase/lipase
MIDTAAEERAARRRGEHRPQPLPVSGLAHDRVVAAVPVRVFTPSEVRGVYVHVHGGGFVYGSSRLQDDRLERLALACRVAVVSLEYRLAPEDPFPAGTDDCEAAALWLVENAQDELGSGRLCIGGESAGANLALVTLLRLRDRHGFTGFRAACLVKGVYDLSLARVADTGDADELSREGLEALVVQYAAGHDRADPGLSPLNADLRALPPAMIAVGDADPLLDDSRALAERSTAAGDDVELAVVPGAGHELEPEALLHTFLAARLDA